MANLKDAIQYVNNRLQNIDVPGAGVTIVSAQKNIFTHTYGLCPYTPTTAILLASVSKTLTGTAVCMLEHDNPGKIINAKANITTIYPYVSENMLVKDLLSHRSGIPEQYGTVSGYMGNSREMIIKGIVSAPNRNFRNEHQYTNIPFTQGAVVAAKTGNMSLQQMYHRLFTAAGMKNSSINYVPYKYTGYADLSLVAANPTNQKWYQISHMNMEAEVSAGGIYTTLNDMTSFLRFHLQQAALPSDKRIISNDFYEGLSNRGNSRFYGIGININYQTVAGVYAKTFSHNGALICTRTNISWIPDLNIGIFVHVNCSPNGIPDAIVEAFYAKLGGATDAQADVVYNNVNQALTDAIASQLCRIVLKPSTGIKAVNNKINFKIDGDFWNDEWGNAHIINGKIKLANLSYAALYYNGYCIYGFVARDLSQIPYAGTVEIIDNDTLKITYLCESKIYVRI